MMAVSRYGGDSSGTPLVANQVSSPAVSVLAPSGSFVEGLGGGSTVTGTSKSSQSTTTSQLDPKSRAALEALIAQLQGGGTPTMQASTAQRQAEIARNQAVAGQYTKQAAFSDATGAMNAKVAEVLQQLLPNIVRAAEGAGTSQNSLRALLTQQAANNAAQSAATLGLNAATQYGQVNSQIGNILEALTRPQEDQATQALLQALGIAKGANVTSTTTGTSESNQTSPASQRVSSGGVYNAPVQTPSTAYGFAPEPSYNMDSFGPSADGNTYSTSGQSLANFIASTQDPWSSYSF